MAKITLKTKGQKVNELLDMFKLPSVDYTNGYQPKPRPELTGGSAVNSVEAYKIKAVKELLQRTIIRGSKKESKKKITLH
jgi:hypothetical protein